MKLIIFGDSFATATNDGTWISTLANLLQLPFSCFGRPGSSLFYTYKKLLTADITADDTVVIVATSNGRLYSGSETVYGNLPTAMSAKNTADTQQQPVIDDIIAYYMYLQNDDFDHYVYYSLIKDIEHILQSKGCRYLFIQSHDSIQVSNLLPAPTLNSIVHKQNDGINPTICDREYKLTNHLTNKNQDLLARAAYNYLQGQPMKLTLEDFYKLNGIA